MLRVSVICASCVMACGSSPALAEETYSYIGQDYIYCTETYVANCNSDHVSGSFTTTLSLSQLQNLTSYSIPDFDIAGFSFSDGNGLALSQANATVSDLGFTTNGSGNIAWWVIKFQGNDGSSFIATESCLPSTCPGGYTGGVDYSGISAADTGATGYDPSYETWLGPQFTSAPTPEGSGAILSGTGLMILLGRSVIRRQL